METVKVKIVTDSKIYPSYELEGSSGMDIRAAEYVKILPGFTVAVKTGIRVSIPLGYEIQVRPRSGLSLKTKLRVANSPGTVDSGYFGELKILLTNISPVFSEEVRLGDRIAQLVLCPVVKCEWEPCETVEEFGQSERGENGFGSTGVK